MKITPAQLVSVAAPPSVADAGLTAAVRPGTFTVSREAANVASEKTNIDTLAQKVGTVIGTIGSEVGTIRSEAGTIFSLMGTIKNQTDTIYSKNDSILTGADTIQPKNFNILARPTTKRRGLHAFSLVEVLLVVSLLSLIILALMNVFNATQTAFRASLTQTDVLEGSRAAMQLITTDLRGLTPSGGVFGAVNFSVIANNNSAYTPLRQSLPGATVQRTNLLNYFFSLGRQNQKWIGVGYIVDTTSTSPLYPLYRFYRETNTTTSPRILFDEFANAVANAQWTNMSHVMDGVVHLVVRAHDTNGMWMNYNYTNAANFTLVSPYPSYGESQFYMFSNMVPAAVELQLGVLEDRPLARAESLPFQSVAQSNYLAQQSGRVHVFRQLVPIPNVDPTAYQ